MILLRVPAVVSLLLSAIIIASPTDSAADAMRLLDSNQAAAARRLVDAALAKTPGSPLLLAVQARVLWAQGQRDAALASARRAERAGPKDPATQHVLALFYAQSGNRPKAAELESHFARSPQADRAAAGRAALLNFEVGRT